jgi:SAM-dependent methyltransferase
MSAVDTGSLYFEGVPLPLRDVMWRVGASVRPADFIVAIVDAWREVEVVTEEEVQDRFRATRAYRDFRAVLKSASRPAARVLAIGCGRGFAGRSSGYAASVVREVYSAAEVAHIDRLDVTPATFADPRGPYDLIVTHSLLHFVYEFRPICRMIDQLLAPGGAYIMANEPNSRFWNNPECVGEMKRIAAAESRENRLRKLASPSRYWARIRRLGRAPKCWADEINAILRRQLNLTADLTPKEIVRVIDPYVPDPYPGACPIGQDGMNWTDFEAGPLATLVREHTVTSGYVKRSNPDQLDPRYRPLDERLAAQYPLDGCSFTALWRKTA